MTISNKEIPSYGNFVVRVNQTRLPYGRYSSAKKVYDEEFAKGHDVELIYRKDRRCNYQVLHRSGELTFIRSGGYAILVLCRKDGINVGRILWDDDKNLRFTEDLASPSISFQQMKEIVEKMQEIHLDACVAFAGSTSE